MSIRCIDGLFVITQDGDTALIVASGKSGTETIVVLLNSGANMNLQNSVCWHLCMSMCPQNHCAHVEWRVCSDEGCQKW